MSIRKAAVRGGFYPQSSKDIDTLLNQFNTILNENNITKKIKAKAVICPHAGYIYSGFSANAVYANLEKDFKTVVVLGPSHRVYFHGCSAAMYEAYETPHGDLKIDIEKTQNVIKNFEFCNFYEDAHKEHSTETQMPFIKKYFPHSQVIEVVYADISSDLLLKVIESLDSEDTLFVISSDLSHFYDLEKANSIDTLCINAIKNIDTHIQKSGCEACGILGIEAVLKYAKMHRLSSQIVDYRTSFDMSGDKSSVVGYCSAIIN